MGNLARAQSAIIDVSADRFFHSEIEVKKGETYQFIAEGSWQDAHFPPTDANGFKGFTAAMWFGTLLKPKPTHNYMKLCGKVGHWKFGIGKNATVTMKRSGQLKLYANDAKGFYSNNSGTISVTIKKMDDR